MEGLDTTSESEFITDDECTSSLDSDAQFVQHVLRVAQDINSRHSPMKANGFSACVADCIDKR